ncbi:hypothetical protein [Spiroplasma clarkii]|nr:hypothetical protein [Spiroplasma clarkii]
MTFSVMLFTSNLKTEVDSYQPTVIETSDISDISKKLDDAFSEM